MAAAIQARGPTESTTIARAAACLRLVFNRVGVFRIYGSGSNLTGDFRIQKQTGAMINQHIRLEERLSILRSEDQFRQWHSLDDKRFCILCERTFDGRQVDIRRSSGGRFRLHCPTEDCSSTPQHWVRPGNPLVSAKVYQDWSVALSVPKKTTVTSK